MTHKDTGALGQMEALEAEAIHIIREVAAQMERPAILFSGGKDSIVLVHLAMKAFAPARLPMPLIHIDTGHNFPEVIEARDRLVESAGLRLIVGSVEEGIACGLVHEEPNGSRNRIQTPVLLEVIREHGFDACLGGARRDEERSRAKERVFSFRDEFGQWDPRNQRPELWSLYNGLVHRGEHLRVFPLSNWTELDVWTYIGEHDIEVPSLYRAHERDVFLRDGLWMAVGEHCVPSEGESVARKLVRFRTVGDATLTASVESSARTIEEIILETASARITERGATRGDDRVSDAAMEDRKKEGYF